MAPSRLLLKIAIYFVVMELLMLEKNVTEEWVVMQLVLVMMATLPFLLNKLAVKTCAVMELLMLEKNAMEETTVLLVLATPDLKQMYLPLSIAHPLAVTV